MSLVDKGGGITNIIKVLIADDNEGIRKSMADYFRQLKDFLVVGTACNGAEAIELTLQHHPDVVVLDLVMPINDGFCYLETIRKLGGQRPDVIVLSAMGREDTITRAMDLGASFYMLKPFDYDVLYRRIRMLQGMEFDESRPATIAPAPQQDDRGLSDRINSLFLSIGMPSYVQGYGFLKEAVRLVVEDWESIHYITKELYPSIAKQFNTTSAKVERSMRHAITITWQRSDLDSLSVLLGIPAHNVIRKPTNGEFIALVADRVKLPKTA